MKILLLQIKPLTLHSEICKNKYLGTCKNKTRESGGPRYKTQPLLILRYKGT